MINVNDALMLPTAGFRHVVRKQKMAKVSVREQIVDVAKIHGYEIEGEAVGSSRAIRVW